LGALIDLVLTHPIAIARLIAKELGVTPRAAQNLVAELGLREATGRGRYRAWGIV
jgi:predicted transcriptional regulator